MIGEASVRMGWAALALAGLVLVLPAVMAPIPPITDYPNHLARLWMLSGSEHIASVSQFYRLQFDTFTNVGIDLIALTVGRLTDYQIAGQLSVIAAIVLPALGGALLWRSVWGRFDWWMLAFGMLVWGQNLLSGFLNFEISIGLALLFAAWEPGLERQRPAVGIAVRAVLSLILIVTHLFGFLFYGLLLASLILGPTLNLRQPSYRRAVLHRAGLTAISLLAAALLFVVAAPRLPGAQVHSSVGSFEADIYRGLADFAASPRTKLLNTLLALRAYSTPVDFLAALCLAAPVVLSALLRRLRVHAGLVLLSIVLLIGYLVCPPYLLGTYWVDARFAGMLPLAAAAAVMPELPPLLRRATFALLVLAFVGRTAVIGAIWRERQADVVAVARALEAVPPGATVLPVEQRPARGATVPIGRYTELGENSFRHLGALAVPWRQAFVPTLFTARGKQPIAVVPPYDQIAEPDGAALADVHALDRPEPGGTDVAVSPFVKLWRTRFDYVLVLNADIADRSGPFMPPPALSLVRDAGFAKLFRIARSE